MPADQWLNRDIEDCIRERDPECTVMHHIGHLTIVSNSTVIFKDHWYVFLLHFNHLITMAGNFMK